ncbi:selenocysteine-specific translation elongation factor [Robertmurraya kyonggiensis]|uniref:Selenocysteine-specific elongation factor n=1 Tax=Robertmurraya kyonggiensis TaxID=1037680 RepID=A0A4V5P1M7_9BACI|nr:selenocysteine-specific translation elongation factor [Robertmurraya kyonggiensis]TKC18790.1 selenocysteine-specific translation elongation factor [Robertmurraya kyonggiensis]
MKRYFTIGMAGHIDHGKTTLTKALTNVDTDRLKEEKERQISIELGFAPLYEDEELQISVVDVPGHERFIRQMIAGVAGIDLVVLVVAADEGVMPQTREHLDILGFLGIKNGIVAISKIDRVEEEFIELVQEDIREELRGTVFEDARLVVVDSLSHKGIEELKKLIIHTLKEQETRDVKGAFRLPIDQVFTVKGQGTVVRGTVYEGRVEEGQTLTIMPKGLEVKARQIQVHHKPAKEAFAGQRAAINLAGVAKEEIERGDVVVSSEHFNVTNTIDVAIRVVEDLDYMVKQRMPIKCHLGTAEVMGRIVFFDRNELKEENGEILCQIRLDEEIVAKRGDRFILRRPSPQETIGGGWVIDPKGQKYRFGDKTIAELEKKKVGTPGEQIVTALMEAKSLSLDDLITRTSLDRDVLIEELNSEDFVLINGKEYTLRALIEMNEEDLYNRLRDYHTEFPMKQGLNKGELIQEQAKLYPKVLLDFVIEEAIKKGIFKRKAQYIAIGEFEPHVPKSWKTRTENMLEKLKSDGMKVQYFQDYLTASGIPDAVVVDLKKFLEEDSQIVALDSQYYWHGDVFRETVAKLQAETGPEFEVGEAKDLLGLSRKFMIPFLETLDAKGYTNRVENKRVWK